MGCNPREALCAQLRTVPTYDELQSRGVAQDSNEEYRQLVPGKMKPSKRLYLLVGPAATHLQHRDSYVLSCISE